jgi:hypothetical protein
MAKRVLMLLMLAWTFFACKEAGLKINVRYDETPGLEVGDRVIFEQNDIGRVTGVSHDEGGHTVANLMIKNGFAGAATDYARFFVIRDPKNEERTAIEMVVSRSGGLPLEADATVQGSTGSSAVFGQASGRLEQGLEGLKKGFEQFAEDLKGLPESEEWKRLEEDLARLVEEMKQSGRSAQETIQKELLPKLQEEIEKLRERLRQFGGEEKEVDPMEVHVEEIREI